MATDSAHGARSGIRRGFIPVSRPAPRQSRAEPSAATGVTQSGLFGDRTRRTIVERLAGHAQTLGQLAADLPVSRPAVSQHLKVLKDAGLVVDQPVGNRRIHRVNPDGIAALRAQLDR